MNRYRIRISVDGKRKLYYIEDQENYDIVLLPSKYLKHKADANRSPNTVRRLALSICYYLNYLDQTGTKLLQVAKKSFEEQSSHFGQFLYWLVEGRHITDNRTAKTGNGTCNAYLKDVFGFFLYLADNGYTEPLRVLAYNQITVSNAVGVKRTIRSKSFKGYLKEKDRNVRAAQEPEIIDILRACTNLRDQLLLLLLAETGFRIGEILGVDYTKDIDYEKQVLKVYFRDDNDNEARAKNAEYRSAKISRETFEFLLHYLAEYPQVQSCRDLNREIIEEYLTYLKTEATGTKHYHADLNRLRSLLESTGQMCDYPNLIGLFLTRDIPPTPKAAFKTYSDAELKRLNREIVKLDAQTARLMIIHQMLGTRISDTLTLTPDCLSERNGEIIIRIRQMKTKPYEKPISAELAALIKKAIAYTKEKYGDTTYIFVDEKNPSRPMPYTTVQFRITDMIYKKELRDDNGEIFGFGTHIYRHYYGMKLTEMHLDDWTIAKLLGHSSVRNVKYYRKMSNQLLADETRKARQRLSAVILDNLDGWEAEYEQIRQDDRLQ